MKKSFKLLAPLLVMLFIFTACAPGGNTTVQSPSTSAAATTTQTSSKPVDLTFWLLDGNPKYLEGYSAILKKVEEQYDDINKIDLVGLPWEQSLTKLTTAAVAGTLPDASSTIAGHTISLIPQNVIEPLDTYFEKFPQKDKISKVYLEYVRNLDPARKKSLWYLPTFSAANHNWYRADMMKKYGIKLYSTIDEWFDNIAALTRDGVYGYGMRGGAGAYYTFLTFLMNYCDTPVFFNEDGSCFLGTPKAQEGLERYVSIFLKKQAPPATVNNGYPEMAADFANGATAMFTHHLGSMSIIIKDGGLKQEQVGYAPIPLNDKGRRIATGEPHGVQMFSTSKHKELTWEMLSYFLLPDAQKQIISFEGGIPVNSETDGSASVYLPSAIKMMSDPATVSLVEPYYLVDYSAYQNNDMLPDFQAMLLGQKKPADCLSKWSADMEAMYKKYLAK